VRGFGLRSGGGIGLPRWRAGTTHDLGGGSETNAL
jgi:hypothetical protein